MAALKAPVTTDGLQARKQRRASTLAQDAAFELSMMQLAGAADEAEKARRMRHKDLQQAAVNDIYSPDELKEYQREENERDDRDGVDKMLASLQERVKKRQLAHQHSSSSQEAAGAAAPASAAAGLASASPFNKLLHLVTSNHASEPSSPTGSHASSSSALTSPSTPLARRRSIVTTAHSPSTYSSRNITWDQQSSAEHYHPPRPHAMGSYGVVDVVGPTRSQRSFSGANPFLAMNPSLSTSGPLSSPQANSASFTGKNPWMSQGPAANSGHAGGQTLVSQRSGKLGDSRPGSVMSVQRPTALTISTAHHGGDPNSPALSPQQRIGAQRARRVSVDLVGLQDALSCAMGVMSPAAGPRSGTDVSHAASSTSDSNIPSPSKSQGLVSQLRHRTNSGVSLQDAGGYSPFRSGPPSGEDVTDGVKKVLQGRRASRVG